MNFTIEEGIQIQESQLKEWKSVLSATAYEKLEQLAKADNKTATSGFDICRGTDLDMIVHNKLMKHHL